MQKATIKEVKEISKEGKKTFFAVTLDNGAKVNTFDTKIKEAKPEDGIEFEPVLSGNFTNMKDGWTLTKASKTNDAPKVTGTGMTKEEWDQKQRVERASIEAQVAVKCILQIYNTLLSTGNKDSRISAIAEKAMQWCDKRLSTYSEPKTATKTEATTLPKVEPTDEPLNNVGDLFRRCVKYNITRTEALAILKVEAATEITDVNEAWDTIYKVSY